MQLSTQNCTMHGHDHTTAQVKKVSLAHSVFFVTLMRDCGSRARGVGFGTCSAQEMPHGSFPLPQKVVFENGWLTAVRNSWTCSPLRSNPFKKEPQGGRAGDSFFLTLLVCQLTACACVCQGISFASFGPPAEHGTHVTRCPKLEPRARQSLAMLSSRMPCTDFDFSRFLRRERKKQHVEK